MKRRKVFEFLYYRNQTVFSLVASITKIAQRKSIDNSTRLYRQHYKC